MLDNNWTVQINHECQCQRSLRSSTSSRARTRIAGSFAQSVGNVVLPRAEGGCFSNTVLGANDYTVDATEPWKSPRTNITYYLSARRHGACLLRSTTQLV